MKNIYFIQANPEYGGEVALPYAPGMLAAYAMTDEKLARDYRIAGIFCRKETVGELINKLDKPFLVGFSCYIWNFEYSKKLAVKIKEKYPECFILFGGHSVADNSSELLEEIREIDFLIHAEGEVPFRRLLHALSGDADFSEVSNLSYRKDGKVIKTDNKIYDVSDFPSPYLSGTFDELISDGRKYYAVFETNRGCPFSCSYCDWGNHKAKVRMFPIEKALGELEWFSDKKLAYVVSSDANFGMFERDKTIIEKAVELKDKTGYPQRIQFCFTKNSNDLVFELNSMMNKSGLSKGATLSIQTFSPEALEYIGRKNMSYDEYKESVRKYNEAGICAYTDMILGLPGETYDSFTRGIELLLDAGQHTGVNVFNCERLVNSVLGNPEAEKKYGIKTAKCSINRHHSELGGDTEENNEVIVATFSMPESDWVKSNLYSATTGALHNLGLTQLIAIFSATTKKTGYRDFYDKILSFGLNHPETVFGDTIIRLREMLTQVTTGEGTCETPLPFFGDVNWPVEEWIFLQLQEKYESFYSELKPLIREMCDDECFEDLFEYQKSMIKVRGRNSLSFDCSYDFPSFFKDCLSGNGTYPEKKNLNIEIKDENAKTDPVEYARFTVWYGRKGGRNIYREEMTVTEAENR